MTELYWVRHGPTHARTMIGWTDRPADLSDRPRIERLRRFLPARARLVSSDLSRAVATADVLAAEGHDRLPHDPDLREIHFGAWEDRSYAEIEEADPELCARYWAEPGPVAPPGGESWDALAARVSAAADRLAGLDGPVIVVAHFGAILSQIGRARGVAPPALFSQRVEPLSVSRLTWDGTRWCSGRVNHHP